MSKYGDSDITWGPQTVRRMKSWGFNTVLDHYVMWVHPIQTCGGCTGWENGQPVRTPAVWFIDAASYPLRNVFNLAPQPGKDLLNGVSTVFYNDYRAPNPDPFDPNFAAWIQGYMKTDPSAQQAGNSPWVMGFSLAESDYIFGFGAGPDFPTLPAGKTGPHLSVFVLVSSPTQSSNSAWGATYADKTVYAKVAFKNFLQTRYSTIAALNTAWGSNYTTFDSAGGWGPGTGLMDEDGRHAWVPRDVFFLSGAGANIKKDLDDFLFQYASQWFKTQRDALKAAFPKMLYLGPNVVGSWAAPARKQVIQAAALYIDVFMTSVVWTGGADDQARLDFTMQNLGDKPIASWFGILANADSSQFASPNPDTFLTAPTQAQRGVLYQQAMNWFVNVKATATGSQPFAGMRWWAWLDNPVERADWGLVTVTDNAYDGKEAVAAVGTDAWGHKTGGERRNYGDFLTAVRSANLRVLSRLVEELGAKPASAQHRGPGYSPPVRSPSPSARQGSNERRRTEVNVATSAHPRQSQAK